MNYIFKFVLCMSIFTAITHAMEKQEYSIARKADKQTLSVMRERRVRKHAAYCARRQERLAKNSNKENNGDFCNIIKSKDPMDELTRKMKKTQVSNKIVQPRDNTRSLASADMEELAENAINNNKAVDIALVNEAVRVFKTSQK
jgi:hypothetical protein